MQIDFHHTVTYVVARYAGFDHDDAALVAHCAQYIDDATNAGTVTFDGDVLYRRLASAHKMLDYRNLQQLKNHIVWIRCPGSNRNCRSPVIKSANSSAWRTATWVSR